MEAAKIVLQFIQTLVWPGVVIMALVMFRKQLQILIGIRAKKYFWLNEIEGFRMGMTSHELAKLLDGKEWH